MGPNTCGQKPERDRGLLIFPLPFCVIYNDHAFKEIIQAQQGIPKWKGEACLLEIWITVDS